MVAKGFRKPFGPLAVAFGDIEVRPSFWSSWLSQQDPTGQKKVDTTSPADVVAGLFEGANLLQVRGQKQSKGKAANKKRNSDENKGVDSAVATGENDVVGPSSNGEAAGEPQSQKDRKFVPPLVRVFYPAEESKASKGPFWKFRQWPNRRWLPQFMYAVGFAMVVVKPTSLLKQALLWLVAVAQWFYVYPSSLPAWLRLPLISEESSQSSKLPVVVWSHGMWAMRTTYSALACDLASHGYVVVCIEHRDGSACMSQYTQEGKEGRLSRGWLPHVHLAFDKGALSFRHRQLQQRVSEVRAVFDLLAALNKGSVPASANMALPGSALNPGWLAGRLDLNRVALAGHSFGAATAVATAGVDSRSKATIALDVWSEPWGQEEFTRKGGPAPLLLVASEGFDWAFLRETRNKLLEGRTAPTEKYTIKGSTHHHQSDLPLVAPQLIKAMKMAGTIEASVAQDCSSQACLSFLAKNIPKPTTKAAGNEVSSDVHLSEKAQAALKAGRLGKTELQQC